jgi:hypothetical protein
MTRQKTFKHRVRERMSKTGESYAAARRVLLASAEPPAASARTQVESGAPAEWKPPVSEARVLEVTGRGWQHWLRALDRWGAARRTHTQIAEWLGGEHELPGWYAQAIAVGYERARGLRAPGQKSHGFAVTASRTVGVPLERLMAAFEDARRRARWLPDARLRRRPSRAARTLRFDWEDGATRVAVWFEAADAAKSRVVLAHERLPDAAAAEQRKLWWRERLGELKAKLEGGQL